MILGLVGLAGSGKSTVADILQKDHGFVSVALADPIKRICSEAFGFTDKQLWGPSEERNKPDELYPRQGHIFQFERYGRAVSHEGMTNIWLCRCGRRIESMEQPVPGLREYPCVALTPRFALQQLGTEWGRNCYQNVWIDYAVRVAEVLLTTDRLANERTYAYSAKKGLFLRERGWVPVSNQEDGRRWNGVPNGVVFSDIRFQNEVEAIRAAGGAVWRIVRPGAGLKGTAGAHLSETEQLSIPDKLFTLTLDNDGSLDDLVETVNTAVNWMPAVVGPL